MDIVINVIGYFIGILVGSVVFSNIILTPTLQIPFLNKLKKSGVITEDVKYGKMILTITISLSALIIVSLVFISFAPLGFLGLAQSFLQILKPTKDPYSINLAYSDMVRYIRSVYKDVDEYYLDRLAEVIDSIDNYFAQSQKSQKSLQNIKSNYTIPDDMWQKVLSLEAEINTNIAEYVRILIDVRDRSVLSDVENWDSIFDEVTLSNDLAKVRSNIDSMYRQQDMLLLPYMQNK